MSTNNVTLHRVLKSTPARIHRAFILAGAFAKWLPPYGYFATVHEMDARVDGRYHMSFTNLTTGASHGFSGVYLELEEGKRIVYTATFDGMETAEPMQTSVSLRQADCGVVVDIVQEGIPAFIPVEGCYLGWQESLEQLARLVEPEIKQ